MRRILALVMVLALFVVSTPVSAGDGQCPVGNQFKTGLKNVVTAPVELSDNVMAETKDAKFFPFAFVGGFLKGTFYMGKKLVTGTWQIVTSPLAYTKK